MTCERAFQPPGVARNMSAPPRTRLTFAPLLPGGQTVDGGDRVAAASGLRFICRLDLRSHFPVSMRADDSSTYNDDDVRRESRLQALMALVRGRAAGRAEPTRAQLRRAQRQPIDTLTDELEALVNAVRLDDIEGVNLPPVGLFVQYADTDARPVFQDFTQTIAILARRRGSLFLRDAQPIVWNTLHGRPVDLWQPVAASIGSTA